MASLGRSELIDAEDQVFQCLYLFSVLFLFDIQAHTQTTACYWVFAFIAYSVWYAVLQCDTPSRAIR